MSVIATGRSRFIKPDVDNADQAGFPVTCRQRVFDAFGDHQFIAGIGKSDGPATAWAEHHLLRRDRSLAATIAGQKGTVNADRLVIPTADNQCNHRRPAFARRVFQARVEAKAQWGWHQYAATAQVGYEQGVGGRNRRLPNAKGSSRP